MFRAVSDALSVRHWRQVVVDPLGTPLASLLLNACAFVSGCLLTQRAYVFERRCGVTLRAPHRVQFRLWRGQFCDLRQIVARQGLQRHNFSAS